MDVVSLVVPEDNGTISERPWVVSESEKSIMEMFDKFIGAVQIYREHDRCRMSSLKQVLQALPSFLAVYAGYHV